MIISLDSFSRAGFARIKKPPGEACGWGVCCNVYHILDVYHTPRCPLKAGTEFAGQRPALDVIYANEVRPGVIL